MFRGFLVLDERDATLRLDRPEAERAIRTRPRQHDADRAPFQLLSERTEEVVDRGVAIDGGTGGQRKGASADRHVGVRGNHVDVVGQQPQAVGHGDDRHDRGPGQDRGQLALVPGVEVLDQHECHAGVGGELSEKLAEGLEPAGGGADADDRERRSF